MAINSDISIKIECENPTWLEIINKGLAPPEVTGGSIELPDGGIRRSKAAVTGGIYVAGSEPASYAVDNGMKIIESLAPEEFREIINSKGLSCTAEDIKSCEDFFTNILKNELVKTADEYMDNPDEVKATREVLDSICVKVTVSDFDFSFIKENIADIFRDAFGGES